MFNFIEGLKEKQKYIMYLRFNNYSFITIHNDLAYCYQLFFGCFIHHLE